MDEFLEYGGAPGPESPFPSDRRRSYLPVLIGLLAGLIFLAVLPYMAQQVQYAVTRGRERARAEVAREQLAQFPEAVNRFRLAAQAVEPSVVGIETVRVVGGPMMDDEWSSFFFPRPRLGLGQGSGVIVDPEGYIVTNFHVINGASQIAVRLADGRTVHDVRIVGYDPPSDLAVLKLNAPGLVAAPWGDSEKLEVGDQVLAVGSPFGLAQTVTAGIISAKERRGLFENLDLQDFLQTDAAINPGNSGGPLVNLAGEVVGINTAIVGQTYQGIGFAIPSKLAQDVYSRIKAGEKVSRGWLGVSLQDLNEQLADQLKVPELRGALVAEVLSGSPADRAGIRPGDVIIQWAGKRVDDANNLRFLVAGTRPGSNVQVVLHRAGEKLTLTVRVGERPPRTR